MFWKKLLLIQIPIILVLQDYSTADPTDANELQAQVKSSLAYQARRLKHLQPKVQPKYASDLQDLLNRYTDASKATDPLMAQKQVLEFEAQQDEAFRNYLQSLYDEQFLEVDIRLQEWTMRELLRQLDTASSRARIPDAYRFYKEIVQLLPAYDRAAKGKDFEEKSIAFSEIQNRFSAELWDFLKTEREDLTMTNAQLEFFNEFIAYLYFHVASGYKQELEAKNKELQEALGTEDMEKKNEVIDSFDDTLTKFGRYLDYKMIEFEFDRFIMGSKYVTDEFGNK